jgi:AP2 domain
MTDISIASPPNSSSSYYVYIVFRLDGTPCYVGKGKGFRYGVKHKHNPHYTAILNNAKKIGRELPIVIIRENLTEYDAFETEKAFIASIGREAFGGSLVNLTDGGEGAAGHSWTEEYRKRISQKLIGFVFSEERKTNISKGLTGKKRGPHSQNHKDAIAKANKGKDVAIDTRAKINLALTGKTRPPPTEATRKKQRESALIRGITAKVKKKMQDGAARFWRNNQLIWITNGIYTRRILKTEQIPEGWRLGRIRKPIKTHKRRCRSDSQTGEIGVNQDKRTGRWRAYISKNNRRINLGFYSTKDEAVAARRKAE